MTALVRIAHSSPPLQCRLDLTSTFFATFNRLFGMPAASAAETTAATTTIISNATDALVLVKPVQAFPWLALSILCAIVYFVVGRQNLRTLLGSLPLLIMLSIDYDLTKVVIFAATLWHWRDTVRSSGVRWYTLLFPCFLSIQIALTLFPDLILHVTSPTLLSYWNNNQWAVWFAAFTAHFIHTDLLHTCLNSHTLLDDGEQRLSRLTKKEVGLLFLLTIIGFHLINMWAYDYRLQLVRQLAQERDDCFLVNYDPVLDRLRFFEILVGGPLAVTIGFSGIAFALHGYLDGLTRLNLIFLLLPLLVLRNASISHLGHIVGLATGVLMRRAMLIYVSVAACEPERRVRERLSPFTI